MKGRKVNKALKKANTDGKSQYPISVPTIFCLRSLYCARDDICEFSRKINLRNNQMTTNK